MLATELSDVQFDNIRYLHPRGFKNYQSQPISNYNPKKRITLTKYYDARRPPIIRNKYENVRYGRSSFIPDPQKRTILTNRELNDLYNSVYRKNTTTESIVSDFMKQMVIVNKYDANGNVVLDSSTGTPIKQQISVEQAMKNNHQTQEILKKKLDDLQANRIQMTNGLKVELETLLNNTEIESIYKLSRSNKKLLKKFDMGGVYDREQLLQRLIRELCPIALDREYDATARKHIQTLFKLAGVMDKQFTPIVVEADYVKEVSEIAEKYLDDSPNTGIVSDEISYEDFAEELKNNPQNTSLEPVIDAIVEEIEAENMAYPRSDRILPLLEALMEVSPNREIGDHVSHNQLKRLYENVDFDFFVMQERTFGNLKTFLTTGRLPEELDAIPPPAVAPEVNKQNENYRLVIDVNEYKYYEAKGVKYINLDTMAYNIAESFGREAELKDEASQEKFVDKYIFDILTLPANNNGSGTFFIPRTLTYVDASYVKAQAKRNIVHKLEIKALNDINLVRKKLKKKKSGKKKKKRAILSPTANDDSDESTSDSVYVSSTIETPPTTPKGAVKTKMKRFT